jgi:hypothetical protein
MAPFLFMSRRVNRSRYAANSICEMGATDMRKGGCSLTVSGWLKVFVGGLLALLCCTVLSVPASQASDEMEAKQSFEVFKEAWLGKLNQHGEYGWEKIKVEQESQDSCAARYKIITRATDSEVKATGDKLTPFVGILKYEEQTYICRASTSELAKQGPFTCEREVVITEIFRYANGKWLY